MFVGEGHKGQKTGIQVCGPFKNVQNSGISGVVIGVVG
jgi:hypothetical protein